MANPVGLFNTFQNIIRPLERSPEKKFKLPSNLTALTALLLINGSSPGPLQLAKHGLGQQLDNFVLETQLNSPELELSQKLNSLIDESEQIRGHSTEEIITLPIVNGHIELRSIPELAEFARLFQPHDPWFFGGKELFEFLKEKHVLEYSNENLVKINIGRIKYYLGVIRWADKTYNKIRQEPDLLAFIHQKANELENYNDEGFFYFIRYLNITVSNKANFNSLPNALLEGAKKEKLVNYLNPKEINPQYQIISPNVTIVTSGEHPIFGQNILIGMISKFYLQPSIQNQLKATQEILEKNSVINHYTIYVTFEIEINRLATNSLPFISVDKSQVSVHININPNEAISDVSILQKANSNETTEALKKIEGAATIANDMVLGADLTILSPSEFNYALINKMDQISYFTQPSFQQFTNALDDLLDEAYIKKIGQMGARDRSTKDPMESFTTINPAELQELITDGYRLIGDTKVILERLNQSLQVAEEQLQDQNSYLWHLYGFGYENPDRMNFNTNVKQQEGYKLYLDGVLEDKGFGDLEVYFPKELSGSYIPFRFQVK